MYKAISVTYLKGYTSSYIDDFVHFPANTIETGVYQEWGIASDYNKEELPEFITPINDSLETVAFMVIKNDSIVFEEYWHGYSADSMSNSYSMAKSWVGTLIGVAIKDGDIKSVDQKVCDFLPNFCEGRNTELTIRDLLTMSSGLNWTEDYYNPIGQTAQAYYGSDLKRVNNGLKSSRNPWKSV